MLTYLLLDKIFGNKIADWDDFGELTIRFFFDLLVVFIIVRLLYYPVQKRKDYLFTYFLFNVLIFFLCFLLSNVKLSIGFAFGLFAIFGILRYRTESIPIREMTYLFIVIAIAVLNALTNKKVSYLEIFFTNFSIVFITYLIEKVWLITHENRKVILYDNIELIKPERYAELLEDLKRRTGLNIHKVVLGKIDLVRETATLYVFYYEEKLSVLTDDDSISDSNSQD